MRASSASGWALPVELIAYEAAGKVFEAAGAGAWDIAFVAIEPVRAAEIEFTAPYVHHRGHLHGAEGSSAEAHRRRRPPGVRIAVGAKSAYDLYLTRTSRTPLSSARRRRRPRHDRLFVKDRLDVAAGVQQPLVAYAKDHPEVRVIDGPSWRSSSRWARRKGTSAGAAYLRAFIEE